MGGGQQVSRQWGGWCIHQWLPPMYEAVDGRGAENGKQCHPSSPSPSPQNTNDQVNMQHIVVITGVAEATIRGVYR